MKEALLDLLACPLCRATDLSLVVHARDEKEIREGEMVCKACQTCIPIHNGVVQAFLDSAPQVIAESQGWVALLDVPAKQHEFKDEWILSLPFIRPEQTTEPDSVRVWNQVGKDFFENLDRFNWRGKRVLEIGAGRCWGVAELARRGAYAVGLDILAYKYLGLETADVWFAAEDLYFERVLGDMHKLPFRPDVFDFIITTSSLHHTDRLELALREVERALCADGHAFFMNEPVILDGQPKPDLSNSPEVLYNIIESRPTKGEWVAAFNTAGFYVEDLWVKDDMHVILRKDLAALTRGKKALVCWWVTLELYCKKGYVYIKQWVKEKIRRAPSAFGYYTAKLKSLFKSIKS